MMLFYDNLLISTNDYRLLMNLYSGRRKMINETEYKTIINIINNEKNKMKFSNTDMEFIQKLQGEKQILNNKAKYAIDDFIHIKDQNQKKRLLDIDTLTFITSYKCNFNCFYCYQKDLKLPSGDLSEDMIKATKNFLAWYSDKYQANTDISTITISGGEPVLPSNVALINTIATTFPNSKIIIKTNGYYLSELWECLPIKRFDKIAISLDGFEDNHMRRTGIERNLWKDGFRRIIDGMKLVMENGIKLHIASLIDKSNYQSIPTMIDFLEKEKILGDNLVDILFGTILTEGDQIDLRFNSYEEVFEMKSYFKKHVVQYIDNVLWFPDAERLKHIIKRPTNMQIPMELGRCNSEKPIGATILPNGKIAYCEYEGKEDSIVGTYYPKFDFYIEKLKMFTKLNIHTIQKCKTCVYKLLCLGSCPIGRKRIYEPSCGIFKNQYLMDKIGEIID